MAIKRSPEDSHALVAELANRYVDLLSPRDWGRVKSALREMLDQLREDIPDQAEFDQLFEELVANVIDLLGCLPVASLEQAQIYTLSGNSSHRAYAADWIRQRRH